MNPIRKSRDVATTERTRRDRRRGPMCRGASCACAYRRRAGRPPRKGRAQALEVAPRCPRPPPTGSSSPPSAHAAAATADRRAGAVRARGRARVEAVPAEPLFRNVPRTCARDEGARGGVARAEGGFRSRAAGGRAAAAPPSPRSHRSCARRRRAARSDHAAPLQHAMRFQPPQSGRPEPAQTISGRSAGAVERRCCVGAGARARTTPSTRRARARRRGSMVSGRTSTAAKAPRATSAAGAVSLALAAAGRQPGQHAATRDDGARA